MSEKVSTLLTLLSEITTEDLDQCDVETLVQLQYWLDHHQGAVFTKTVGRLDARVRQLEQAQMDRINWEITQDELENP